MDYPTVINLYRLWLKPKITDSMPLAVEKIHFLTIPPIGSFRGWKMLAQCCKNICFDGRLRSRHGNSFSVRRPCCQEQRSDTGYEGAGAHFPRDGGFCSL